MSRIGKTPIYLPAGVSAQISDASITVKGGKGEATLNLHKNVRVEEKATEDGRAYLAVSVANPAEEGAIWGAFRSHINNMVKGVSEGWTKALELNGVGFRMNVAGQKIKMTLGFSHDVEYELPKGVTGTVEGNVLTITGVDKEAVGKTAAEIRSLKKPEPYKGKGFRYTDEVIRRKVGKAAKSE